MLRFTENAAIVEFSERFKTLEDIQELRLGLYNALKGLAISNELTEESMNGVYHIANLLEELELSREEMVHLSYWRQNSAEISEKITGKTCSNQGRKEDTKLKKA